MRELLCECLEFIGKRIKDGTVTAGDVKAMAGTLMSCVGVKATISELAGWFGQSEVNVRSLIKRRVTGKPTRRVYYDFNEVSTKAPESWRARPSRKGG